jgi:integrase
MSPIPCKGGHRERVRLGEGKRDWVTIPVTSLDTANDRFARLRLMVAALVESGKQAEAPGIVADAALVANNPKAFAGIERAVRDLCTTVQGALDKPMTMFELCHLYTSGELQRRYPRHVDKKGKLDATREWERRRLALLCNARNERGRAFGDLAVATVTKADADRAMQALPDTASGTWRRAHSQPLSHVLDIACVHMGLIPGNPLPRGWTDSGNMPAMTAFLYPKEEAKLAGCPKVDIDDRVMWGVQVREGLRPGGVAGGGVKALRWDEIDLEMGTISHKHKTKYHRMWPLDAAVVRVLTWWKKYRPDPEFVFPHVARTEWVDTARNFRDALLAADVDRAALHCERSSSRRPIRAHDLRTTFVTVSFADHRSEAWISARTGHTTATQLARYKRVAETLESLNLGWFAPLDEVLGVGHGVGSKVKITGEKATTQRTACSSNGTEKPSRDRKTPTKLPSEVLSGDGNVSQGGGGGTRASTAPDLDEASLRVMLDLAVKDKQWAIVARLSGQLEEIERVKAATVSPGVASLDAARAKRGRGGK